MGRRPHFMTRARGRPEETRREHDSRGRRTQEHACQFSKPTKRTSFFLIGHTFHTPQTAAAPSPPKTTRGVSEISLVRVRRYRMFWTEFLALKHESRIVGHSSNPVCGFSIMEQVRLCAVWPSENWLGSSMNHIQGLMTRLRMLLPCFRKRMSVPEVDLGVRDDEQRRGGRAGDQRRRQRG